MNPLETDHSIHAFSSINGSLYRKIGRNKYDNQALVNQHKVLFINKCEAKKGRETEKRTANVQMSPAARVV